MMQIYSLSIIPFILSADILVLEPIAIEEQVIHKSEKVISESNAKASGTITLQDRLQRDVSFNTIKDSKGEETISFRGVGHTGTDYYEDGIPLYRSVNGLVDTKFWMNRGDIHFSDGSLTSSNGVSAMGGEVNIIHKKPIKSFESEIDVQLSSNDQYLSAYSGGAVNNYYIEAEAGYYNRNNYDLSNRYDPTVLQGKGDRINSDKEINNVSIKGGYHIDNGTHLALKISRTTSEYGLPPNIYTDLTAPVWDAYSRIDNKEVNSLYLYADHEYNNLTLSLRTYYDNYEDQWVIYNEPSYTTNWPVMTYDDARLGTILKASLKKDDHIGSVIFQFEQNEHIAREEGAAIAPKFVTHLFKGSYLHKWKMNSKWLFDAGISYSLLTQKEEYYSGAAEPADDKSIFNGQLALTYTEENYSLYGSIASKSRMPSMNEMYTFFPWEVPNPQLSPEKSMQYTTGIQYYNNEDILLDVSFFYYDIKDLILNRNNSFINREKAKNYGTLWQLENSTFKNHELLLSYAYTHTRDSEEDALELIPEHRMLVEDTIDINGKWHGYLAYQYVGTRYSANSATYTDEQEKIKAYHLVDLQLIYELQKTIAFRAGIKNVLDEDYEWSYGFPAEGRSYYISLNWKI